MSRTLLMFLVAVLLSGCSPYSFAPSPDVSQPATQPLHLKTTQADNSITVGAQIHIKDPAFLGDVQAIVGQGYVSALGQKCYHIKVLDSNVASERVVLCQSLPGQWIVAPPVWAKSVE